MNKKFTLRVLSTAAVLGMLASSSAFANEVPLTKLEPATPTVELRLAGAEDAPLVTGNITVNGLPIPASTVEENEITLIPVRAIAEALDYEVGWEEEANRVTLNRGAQYITMTLDQDAYTISRMAPVSLGSAPVLVNDSTTYVPVSFLSEIMDAEYTVDGDKLNIILMSPVTVKTVDLEKNMISVEDDRLGEVVVHLADDTVITNAGKAAAKEDIKADSLIHILYSPAMTMSLPPQTTAVKIEVNPNAPVDVEEHSNDEDNLDAAQMSSVTVKTVDLKENMITVEDDTWGEVVVHLADDTVITNAGKAAAKEDIKADSLIQILYSPAMTMSLPPQTTAVKIEINPVKEENKDENADQTVAFEGTIKEIMNEGQILVDMNGQEVVLILSDETNIHHERNKMRYTAEDLKASMKISGNHSMIMTRSLPPQTVVFEIVIAD